jgi:hypothetical protein
VLNNHKDGIIVSDVNGSLSSKKLGYGVVLSDAAGLIYSLTASAQDDIIAWNATQNKWTVRPENTVVKPRSQPIPVSQNTILNPDINSIIATFTIKKSEWSDGFKVELVGLTANTGSFSLWQYETGSNGTFSSVQIASSQITASANSPVIRNTSIYITPNQIKNTYIPDNFTLFELRGKTIDSVNAFQINYLAIIPPT